MTTNGETGPAGVVTTLLHAVDDLNWDVVRASFAEQVTVDYTALWGGSAETMAASELVERWQGLLPGFSATQHLTGPVVLSRHGDNGVEAATTVRAHHVVDTDGDRATWMVAGRYRMTLVPAAGEGWRIDGITLRVAYEEGQRALVDVATRRAADQLRNRNPRGVA
ncbi:nuclear transport factor 2 family protein [Phytoactinopolyspora limicola]|uniref:nuclear transport factor 2 family protein n=1 Tax=Phytoactinopolyspora limicola TaxID=2715536 RepID=UPI00140849DC|nr:nuclear transport factor 2 family protein [Phytoactinopolyspora limicola]